jgi:hypothetical protein
MRVFIYLVVGLLLCKGASAAEETCKKLPSTYAISTPMTVLEVEADEMKNLEEVLRIVPDLPRVPFGYGNQEWEKFKAQLQEGDTIVHFRSDRRSWSNLAGEEGYAIMREGCIFRRFTTLIN